MKKDEVDARKLIEKDSKPKPKVEKPNKGDFLGVDTAVINNKLKNVKVIKDDMDDGDDSSSEGSIGDVLPDSPSILKKSNSTQVESAGKENKKSSDDEKKKIKSEEKQIKKLNKVLLNIFNKILETNNPVNSITSPLSLYFCFAIIAEGLVGKSLKEVADVFNFIDDEVLDSSIIDVLNYIKRIETADLTIKMDNCLFTNKNIKIKEQYAATIRDKYKAIAESLDLGDPTSVKAINDRIVETTNGMIKQGIPMLSPSAFSVLVNTMYFKAVWDQHFDATQSITDAFILSDGKTKVDAEFMVNRNAKVGLHTSDDFEYLAINYKNQTFKFVIEMDKKGKLKSKPSAHDIIKVAKKPQETIEIFIPKFTAQFSGDMISALKELGLQRIFNASKDFSKITDHQMSVSTILQNAFIQVDEQGTEVSLFTFVQEIGEIANSIDAVKFVANHPFYYHIVDTQNDIIIFSGSLNNPTI